jgi:hypothetical protein
MGGGGGRPPPIESERERGTWDRELERNHEFGVQHNAGTLFTTCETIRLMIQVFRGVLLCTFVKSYRRFGGAYCFHFRFLLDRINLTQKGNLPQLTHVMYLHMHLLWIGGR